MSSSAGQITLGRSKVLKKKIVNRLKGIAANANRNLLSRYFGKWKRSAMNTIGMRQLDPFPQRKYARMVMVMNLPMQAPNTNLSYEYVFRINSTYAPDLTGGSSRQPYGRDTLAALYSFYTVNYVTAEVEFYDTDTDGVVVGYQVQGDTISGLTISQIDERPWAKCTSMSNSGEQKKKYFLKIPMHTALGILKSQYKSDTSQYSASYNASPTQGVFLRLFALSTASGAVSNVKMRIKLTQHTTWYTRTSLAQS